MFLILVAIILVIFLAGSVEKFTGLAAVAWPQSSEDPSGRCSMQCRKAEGVLVDPENCCECKTSGGFVTGARNSENSEFRKCMCSLGTGYESYCYKLSTNFLLSQ